MTFRPRSLTSRRTYTTRSPLGYGRPHSRVASGLRLRQPRRLIVPLSADQVARFWRSFCAFRDLAIVALMLLDGLRSCEILRLQLEDFSPPEARLPVLGKGNKRRILPLPAETLEVLQNYLRLERPLTNSPALFVSLKGPRRGRPMTRRGYAHCFVTIAGGVRFRRRIRIDFDTIPSPGLLPSDRRDQSR